MINYIAACVVGPYHFISEREDLAIAPNRYAQTCCVSQTKESESVNIGSSRENNFLHILINEKLSILKCKGLYNAFGGLVFRQDNLLNFTSQRLMDFHVFKAVYMTVVLSLLVLRKVVQGHGSSI